MQITLWTAQHEAMLCSDAMALLHIYCKSGITIAIVSLSLYIFPSPSVVNYVSLFTYVIDDIQS